MRGFSRVRTAISTRRYQARILDIPQGQITRAMGDVHPLGNPHYWLDPENGKVIARSIAGRLAQIRPADQAYFSERLSQFSARLDEAQKRWHAAMAPYKGLKVVTYHRSYTNFADRFGLDVVGYVEPRRAFRRRRSTRATSWSR